MDGARELKIVNGWPNQLQNEPTVMLNFTDSYRFREHIASDGTRSFDARVMYGGALGTPTTNAHVGVRLSWGYNITDLAPPGKTPIRIIKPPKGLGDLRNTNVRQMTLPEAVQLVMKTLQAYVFSEQDYELVGWNTFLKGNLFRPFPYTIQMRRFINDIDVGVSAGHGPIRVTWRLVSRAHEYDPIPASKLHRQLFGSWTTTPDPATIAWQKGVWPSFKLAWKGIRSIPHP